MYYPFTKTFLPAWMILAVMALLLSSCKREPEAITPAPVITSFAPVQAAPGATVVIKGQHFSNQKEKNEVRFHTTPANILSATPGELVVLVPEGAESGKLSVTIGGRSAISSEDFTINAAAPLISGMSPVKGDPGTLVEITGDHFATGSAVFFGAIPASEVTVVGKTTIKAKVPAGVLTDFMKVQSKGLEAVSPQPFYARPLIVSLSPETAREGEEVTIKGANFSAVAGENTISFGSVVVPESSILAASAASLKVKAPANIARSKVTVSVQGLTSGESSQPFTLLPTIAGYSPASGGAGTVVTITGKNLSLSAQVLVGSVAITQFEGGRSTEQIAFKVPAGAASGKIVLKQEEQAVEVGAFQVTTVRQPGVWNKATAYASSPSPRLNIHQGINFMHDDRVFIGYGYSSLGQLTYSNELTALDITSATNTVLHPDAPAGGRPSQRVVATYAKLGSKVYLFGGGEKSGATNEIWEYDIVANSYTKKATVLPNANNTYHAFVYNGGIYLYIYRINTPGAEIYKYDPGADALTLYSNFGGLPFWNGFTVEVIGDLAYFIGGSESRQIKVLDLKNKTRLANIPITNLATPNLMGNFIHFVQGGKIYFGGGWDGINSQPVSNFYVFDPATKGLKQLADIPDLMASYAPPFGVKDGTLYVLTWGGIYSYMP